MPTVREIEQALFALAPKDLAMGWDNVGHLLGDPDEAVERVLDGEDYSKGALYFMCRELASKKGISWFDNNLKFLFKHGCHEFYTEKD